MVGRLELSYALRIDFSFVQILIVLVIALLVFGPKRLPELGKQVGKGIRDFKAQMNSISEDVRTMVDQDVEPDDRGATRAPASVASGPATAVESDDELLDGVVVSGADGPAPTPPAGG